MLATDVRTGETKLVPQAVCQGCSCLGLYLHRAAIDPEVHLHLTLLPIRGYTRPELPCNNRYDLSIPLRNDTG